MTGPAFETALFPLNTVLFPGQKLPLHIFEQRYRQMIGKCIDEKLPFGVVLIAEGTEVGGSATAYPVGTLVEITDVNRLADGRMNVVVEGKERFQVQEITQELPYKVARIQLWPDESATIEIPLALVTEVRELLQTYLTRLRKLSRRNLEEVNPPGEAENLCWFVATAVPFALAHKQRLLTAPGLTGRLEMEADLLRRELLILTRFGGFSVEDRGSIERRKRSLN